MEDKDGQEQQLVSQAGLAHTLSMPPSLSPAKPRVRANGFQRLYIPLFRFYPADLTRTQRVFPMSALHQRSLLLHSSRNHLLQTHHDRHNSRNLHKRHNNHQRCSLNHNRWHWLPRDNPPKRLLLDPRSRIPQLPFLPPNRPYWRPRNRSSHLLSHSRPVQHHQRATRRTDLFGSPLCKCGGSA